MMKDNSIYQNIVKQKGLNHKSLAILLDPEKWSDELKEKVVSQFEHALPDYVFIGGSSKSISTNSLLDDLKEFDIPKILFPGDASQFSPQADAILFLSLLSGRNADYLIGQHVHSALKIKKSGVEVISTGYILIDGGKNSAVQKVSKTSPIPVSEIKLVVSTAIAGELLGMKAIYLEAGSGALQSVPSNIIQAVKKEISIPLIVGGGIRTSEALNSAYQAGADIVVIGNYFEEKPEEIKNFLNQQRKNT